MDREEQIYLAAKTEVDAYDGWGYQKDFDEIWAQGAQWADEHPKNPWISVKDQGPLINEPILAILDDRVSIIIMDGWDKRCGHHPFEYWMPIPKLTFDDILDANKDVLKRIKENGD